MDIILKKNLRKTGQVCLGKAMVSQKKWEARGKEVRGTSDKETARQNAKETPNCGEMLHFKRCSQVALKGPWKGLM